MLTNNFSNSTQLAKSEELSLSERKAVAFKSLIQYFVSDASFNAMLIFETKSDLLCACSASATFAPMLVPLRSNCFERIFSFFPSVRYLYRLTIRMAKSKLLLSIILSIFYHFQLSTFTLVGLRGAYTNTPRGRHPLRTGRKNQALYLFRRCQRRFYIVRRHTDRQ